MIRFSLLLSLTLLFVSSSAKDYVLNSPNAELEISVSIAGTINYSVNFKGKQIISPSSIMMMLDNGIALGAGDKVKKALSNSHSTILRPAIPRKFKEVKDEYNQLILTFKKGYSLTFRAYDDGIAYRWSTQINDSITVVSEQATFNFSENHHIWFPEEESMFSHQEREYKYLQLSEVIPSTFCSTGTLVDIEGGIKVFISESDLLDYPGMYLKGMKENPYGLQGKFAGYPLETEQLNDRSVKVTKHASYLAKSEGNRNFPWRTLIITDNDADLIRSEMIWKLASPSAIEDAGWIKPGKVAWDWWNDLNIYGVDFNSGVNTETYKYYIDFAHDYNLDYIILDEGWYHLEDVLKVKSEVDVKEIIAYGKSKNVGIILWVTWKALYDQIDTALAQFESWGVKGIKVDFMQRDDQWMVNYYTEVAAKAASHHLLVDYHGAYKPAGLHRTYPNVLTFEGLKGLENCKWGNLITPEHDLILPFIRMVAGPMDYTPGAMLNATKDNFNSVWSEPMSQGTRCHQLAMYVIYESPLQMLADNPSNYRKETACMDFLSQVPAIWDDTRVLEAKVSDYLLLARKNGDNWYMGAMTDWEERSMNVVFDFLDDGEYNIDIWQDGVNADRHASDYKKVSKTITKENNLQIYLAPGGGWVAIISPK